MPCNDCGTCITCTETDDYGPAWRNPRFREPVSASEASGALGDVDDAPVPSVAILGRDGGR